MKVEQPVSRSRRRLLRGTLFGVLLFIPGIALADPSDDVRRPIQAAYDRANSAIARKDIAGYLQDLDNSFVQIDRKGVRKNRAADKADLVAIFPMMVSAAGNTVITKITLKGNTAIVNTTETGRIVMRTPAKKQSVIVSQGTNEDIWVRRGGVWKCKQSRQITAKTTVDGKSAD